MPEYFNYDTKMAAQTTSNSTAQPTLTATQARALLQALLDTTPTSNSTHRPSTHPAIPKPTTTRPSPQSRPQPQQMHTHNITIDASTRVMGHCNNVYLSSPLPTEQGDRINEMMRVALASVPKGGVGVNVTVNAGVNLMGSKNAIVVGGGAKGAQASAKNDAESGCTIEGSGMGRKRRAEEPIESYESAEKKVKLEEKS